MWLYGEAAMKKKNFPGGPGVKNPPANAEDTGSTMGIEHKVFNKLSADRYPGYF